MGSYIGIGLVYKNPQQNNIKIVNTTDKIMTFFVTYNATINQIQYCLDTTGNHWIKINEPSLKETYNTLELITQYHFGQIDLTCDIFDIKNIPVIIRIFNHHKDYFGILLDIPEEQLIKEYNEEILSATTEKIIVFLNSIYSQTHFDYGICDSEAEIKYAPEELSQLKTPTYSITALPSSKEKLTVIKSNWHINGLTPRE